MRSHLPTYAALVVTTFFWGSAFNVGAHVIARMSPISAGAERFAIASIVLLGVLAAGRNLDLRLLRAHLPALSAIGVLGIVGFNLAMFFGLRSTTPFNAALIMATTPLWTMLLSGLVEGERIDRWRGAGLASGLAGVVLVISGGDPERLAHLRLAPGDAIVCAGALSWALATVISRRFLPDVDARQTTTWSIVLGTIVMLLIGAWREHPLQAAAQAPASVHWGLLYLAICSSVLGYLFWFDATRRLGPARTAAFFNLVPVFTLLVSLAGGRVPQPAQLLGVVAVIGGVVLASRGRRAVVPADRHVVKSTCAESG
ncbi:DMT family transporter [[Pseudomonas] boreopolis]|uniref:Membrane protein n=1 Tax=Xanthomonas boreopolis TaxID=86183 RepID=A0A919F653_9XANT|nr:membrane protein [[Pseudomonas] boreopolis]